MMEDEEEKERECDLYGENLDVYGGTSQEDEKVMVYDVRTRGRSWQNLRDIRQ